MITTHRSDRANRVGHRTPLQVPISDGPVATTPTLPLLQDAWSRAIASVLAKHR
jgi:hypothetical protein